MGTGFAYGRPEGTIKRLSLKEEGASQSDLKSTKTKWRFDTSSRPHSRVTPKRISSMRRMSASSPRFRLGPKETGSCPLQPSNHHYKCFDGCSVARFDGRAAESPARNWHESCGSGIESQPRTWIQNSRGLERPRVLLPNWILGGICSTAGITFGGEAWMAL